MENFYIAFGLTLFAGLATGIGSTIAFMAKTTNYRFLAIATGFSAGVMLYVSFVEILQKGADSLFNYYGDFGYWINVFSSFGGIALIGLIDYLIPHAENPHEIHTEYERAPLREPDAPIPTAEELQMSMVADPNNTIHSKKLLRMGLFTALAIAIHNFPEGLATFLAALEENQPIGTTGEIAKGSVIAVESDGIYVDIGGKAPGFMPKNECGLGVITNLKERFPKGLQVEVLVTREQNADGMVTISCRALELRKSWDKVQNLAKEGKVIRVKINGFNRGGVTCDFEGLRGFIPRSQLEDGENHQSLVSKTINTAFLEVNPERRKLVLSEKKAVIASRFSELEIGQLIEGEILTIKPYGFFVDLKGVSGLLHHSMVTNGSMRSLREVFQPGESIKALITDLDPSRGRIGLNTALLEGPPGELITDKTKVMEEANERAIKARNSLNKEKVDPQKEKEEINLSS